MQSWQVLFWFIMMYGVLCGVPDPITIGMSKNGKTKYVMKPEEVKSMLIYVFFGDLFIYFVNKFMYIFMYIYDILMIWYILFCCGIYCRSNMGSCG